MTNSSNKNDKTVKKRREKTLEEEIFSAPTEVLAPSSFFAKLIVLKGGRPGQEIAINKDEMTIGRDLKADIKIRDTIASKRHAILSLKGDDVYITDLNSSNGTFVNGKRMLPNKETHLNNGDSIDVGKTKFEFEGKILSEEEFETKTEILAGQLIGKLKVLRGSIPFQDYDVRSGYIIGRVESCDICIPDNFVTDEHAKIAFAEGKANITDIDSSNGTFVNGRQLTPGEPRALIQNDIIKIGNVELQFEYFERREEFEIGTEFDIRKTYGKLKVIGGSLLGWEYDARHGLTFGRSEENDVVITSKLASDKHARIDIINEKPVLVDLDSKNGTRINGKNITRKTLYGGDKIEIGDIICQFKGKRSVLKTWVPAGIGVAAVVVVIVAGFLMYKASNRQKLAESHLNTANILFSDRNYDLALEELQKVIEISPKNEEARLLLEETEKRKQIGLNIERAKDALAKEFYEDAKRYSDEVIYRLDPENEEARILKERILKAESQKKEADELLTEIERSMSQKNYEEAIFLANLILSRSIESKYKSVAEDYKRRSQEFLDKQESELVNARMARVRALETGIRDKYKRGLIAYAQEDIRRLLALNPNNRVAIQYSQMIEEQLRKEEIVIHPEDVERAEKLLVEARQLENDFIDYGKDIFPAIEIWRKVKEIIRDENHRLYKEADKKIKEYSK